MQLQRYLLVDLLCVDRGATADETRHCWGGHVCLSWLREVAARTYLLHLVSCTIFTNKSATSVSVSNLGSFCRFEAYEGIRMGGSGIDPHVRAVGRC